MRSLIIKAVEKYGKCLEEGDLEKANGWIVFSCKADMTYNKMWKENNCGTEGALLELASKYESVNKKELANKVLKKAEEIESIIKKLV
jgi:hypothetical protein